MKRTCALVTLSLPVIPCVTNVYSQSAAQQSTSISLPLRVAATESFDKSTNRVPFKTIAKGIRSGIREPSQIAIRSQTEWQKVWRQHTSASTAPAPLPSVDFDKEIVAAVFLGQKPTSGYGVEISAAEVSDGSLTVFVKETSPNPRAIVTQGITQPFHIVRIETAGVERVSFRRAL